MAEKGARKPPKKFERLRKAMRATNITGYIIAKELGCSDMHVSHCLNGKAQFSLAQAYVILAMLRVPVSEVYKYFEPGEIAN